MAYAIIEMGGKQYRVAEGDSILVDRVGEDEGAKVTPRTLLFADGKSAVMEGADLGKVKVEAIVTEHVKVPKIRVATYRPKKRQKRQMGHRSHLSRLEIKKISGPSGGRSTKKPEPAAETEKKEESDGT